MQYAKDTYHFKVIKSIAKIALEENGVIFGGYPRDIILHDNHAKRFYDTDDVDFSRYDDPEYLPELQERLCIPSDIDCFFENTDSFNSFVRTLKENKYHVQQRASCDPKRYISTMKVNLGDIMLIKMIVSTMHIGSFYTKMLSNVPLCVRSKVKAALYSTLHDIPKYEVCIDALVVSPNCTRKLHPPFNNLDFRCNSLVLTKYGIGVMKDMMSSDSVLDNHDKVASIIDDIISRKAVVAGISIPSFRIQKMVAKGWKISGGDVCMTNADNDDCIICHQNFATTEVCYKLKCCAAKYHGDCLEKACEHNETGMCFTNTCLHCRGVVFVMNDLDLVRALK